MRRSDFIKRFKDDRRDTDLQQMRLAIDAHAEWAARLIESDPSWTWEPEEPEGFNEWFEANRRDQEGKNGAGWALAGWRAALAHQEAQERTNATPPDPGVRRREIEAQIEAWARFQAGYGPTSCLESARASELVSAGRSLLRNYLKLEGY